MTQQEAIDQVKATAPWLAAFAEIVGSIQAELVDELTGKQVALVIAALDRHWHRARAFEAHEVLSNGYIWDSRVDAMRMLGRPLTSDEFVKAEVA